MKIDGVRRQGRRMRVGGRKKRQEPRLKSVCVPPQV